MSAITLDSIGKRILMMGNEAIARGALEGNVRLAAAYPGTPSSEILESLLEASKTFELYVEWSINEKIAFELAFGASLVGARSVVAMKNAGFNWVMDPFMTVSYTGCRAGMLIVVADDPGAHYSSNEQDTRVGAVYNKLICFEPSSQEEALEMARESFSVSESLELPILLRSVTRLSHASGDVTLGRLPPIKDERFHGFNKHWKLPYRWNVYGPPGAVQKHRWLLSRKNLIAEYTENSRFNEFEKGEFPLGIVCSGIGAAYCDEALQNLELVGKVQFLRLGIAHPLPWRKAKEFLQSSRKVLVIEEGDPVVESQLRRFAQAESQEVFIFGKENQILPPFGEINMDLVEEALIKVFPEIIPAKKVVSILENPLSKGLVVPRSSTLCAGCPHLGSYWGLKKAIQSQKELTIVNGDIGCYEQGGYGLFSQSDFSSQDEHKRYPIQSPYTILDTLYVMGSGISLAQGMSHSGYPGKCIAVCGDSTFFHAVLPALANAVMNQADITLLVLDNRWTAMTGHQPSPTTSPDYLDNSIKKLSIFDIVRALGVKKIFLVNAYHPLEVQEALEKAFDFKGPSVVIAEGECMLQVIRRTKRKWMGTKVTAACTGCRTCLQLGCPAIVFQKNKALIDPLQCIDCGLCMQVCPVNAIDGGNLCN
ncbi:MAG: thiamine pyrophosphate-dependent enzyme [Nitrososphaerota archaeon]